MENEKSKETILDTDTKGVPCSFSIPPHFFSPLPYQTIMNVEKQLPPSKYLRTHRFQMLFYANTSTLPCPQYPELTLLSSFLLPVTCHAAIGKKNILLRKLLIIILKGEIYTLSSVFGLSWRHKAAVNTFLALKLA